MSRSGFSTSACGWTGGGHSGTSDAPIRRFGPDVRGFAPFASLANVSGTGKWPPVSPALGSTSRRWGRHRPQQRCPSATSGVFTHLSRFLLDRHLRWPWPRQHSSSTPAGSKHPPWRWPFSCDTSVQGQEVTYCHRHGGDQASRPLSCCGHSVSNRSAAAVWRAAPPFPCGRTGTTVPHGQPEWPSCVCRQPRQDEGQRCPRPIPADHRGTGLIAGPSGRRAARLRKARGPLGLPRDTRASPCLHTPRWHGTTVARPGSSGTLPGEQVRTPRSRATAPPRGSPLTKRSCTQSFNAVDSGDPTTCTPVTGARNARPPGLQPVHTCGRPRPGPAPPPVGLQH